MEPGRAEGAGGQLTAAAERLRAVRARVESHPRSQPALHTLERDRRLGGALLAGALAFRLFAVLLPLALLIAVGLGYSETVAKSAPGDAGSAAGIGRAALSSIAQSSKLSTSARWLVAASGAFALLFAAGGAAKAIHAAHSLAWTGAVTRLARPFSAALVMVAAALGFVVVALLANSARTHIGAGGLVIAIAVVIPFAAIWLGLSVLLPHPGAPWRALVPGALLVGLAFQVIHLATALFIARKLASASATYGPLGAAFTVLGWLFLISRAIVGGAMLNAALWSRRASAAGDARPPQPGRQAPLPPEPLRQTLAVSDRGPREAP